ncbi:spore surface glycoprotein BclB, partial [Desulfosporosinus sp. SRJS8]|nr:spore surface glycoprotein BclB [Desulfosporosinus sp. SRJS8]
MIPLTTGFIENTPVLGIRPSTNLAVRIVNNGNLESSVEIRGFFVTGIEKTQYVLEFATLADGEVATRNYYAQFDAFEFQFIVDSDATEISAWGKDSEGNLTAAHRVLPAELDPMGPDGATGSVGGTGSTGATGSVGGTGSTGATGSVG